MRYHWIVTLGWDHATATASGHIDDPTSRAAAYGHVVGQTRQAAGAPADATVLFFALELDHLD